jgi:c-di-GMP-binding flagellar brake protein YcgR
MSPQRSIKRSFTTLRRKTGQTKTKSEKGIFIVERRKEPRLSMELPLDYCIERKDRFGGVTANISRGGLLVYLPEAIVVGTLLKIEILFARGLELNSIKAIAKVVWSDLPPKEIWREYRYGLEFQSFQKGCLPKLKRLLKEIGETHR